MKKYKLYSLENPELEQVSLSVLAPSVCPNGDTLQPDAISVLQDLVLMNFEKYFVDPSVSLIDYKNLRYNEIDYKTKELILQGFLFDGNTFSLSSSAQFNWNNLKVNESDFTFPVIVSTIDSDEYTLTQANLLPFWTVGKDTVKGFLDSGRDLKKLIFDATDRAGVDAVIDNR